MRGKRGDVVGRRRGEEGDESSCEERREMLLGGEVVRIKEERGEEGDVVERKEKSFGGDVIGRRGGRRDT